MLQSLKKEVPDDDLAAVVEAALYTKEKQHVNAIEILRVIYSGFYVLKMLH